MFCHEHYVDSNGGESNGQFVFVMPIARRHRIRSRLTECERGFRGSFGLGQLCVADWAGGEEDGTDVNVWEDNWDDDNVEEDFSQQLRYVLRQSGSGRLVNTTPVVKVVIHCVLL